MSRPCLAGILLLLFGVLWFASVAWTVFDAQRRGRPGCLVALLVVFAWPWSLLVWLLARPPKEP